ncbi:uncharacterized protein LOC111895717 [Lactuca sativa]|uniref:uncharacterized protein LOC111895717 n=1 Tax=Lactuca sativa TaxID=4236 RepID=UPI000CA78FF6|nr:uncharacterized protein LOC111895717 [Lactuca sativa]
MELKSGLSAFVTGGASGIGRALCVALAKKGIFVTVVDTSVEKGEEVASLSQKENLKFHSGSLKFPSAIFVRCDVTNQGEVGAAFEKHVEVYGGLDICINCADIETSVPFYEDQTDGSKSWRHTFDVNLLAVIDCTQKAIKIMEAAKKPGVVINLGSAYPMISDPIYSSSKGGVVMFTRSLSSYKEKGIRVNVLCPEINRAEKAKHVGFQFLNLNRSSTSMDTIIQGAFQLITDESKAGSCLLITNNGGLEYMPTSSQEAKNLAVIPSRLKNTVSSVVNSTVEIPHSFEQLIIHTLSRNFRNATRTVRAPLKLPIKADHVLLKIIYAGVNAGDVEYSNNGYLSGTKEEISSKLPFYPGLEAVGIIALVGDEVKNLKVGTPAAILNIGAYSEFTMVPSELIIPVESPYPEVVAMLVSGLTASVALEAAHMESGETVLVTAAAGGTGQFAVQLAKLAGNKVVATCGSKDKAIFLRDLGVDRVINYKDESVKDVLKKEFPKGVDIVYESVGGDMFDSCFDALATFGRMLVIGTTSQYKEGIGHEPRNYPGICDILHQQSKTVIGFNLGHYQHVWKRHLDNMVHLFSMGKLKVGIDPKSFVGVQSVVDAVEYIHSGKSIGKVVVCMDPSFNQKVAN